MASLVLFLGIGAPLYAAAQQCDEVDAASVESSALALKRAEKMEMGLEELRRIVDKHAEPTNDFAVEKTSATKLLNKVLGELDVAKQLALKSYNANGPYVIWVDNRTSSTVTAKLYWVDTLVEGAQHRTAPVGGSVTLPLAIGGTNGCRTMLAYILEIYFDGELAASTGIVERNSRDDDEPCIDAFAIDQTPS